MLSFIIVNSEIESYGSLFRAMQRPKQCYVMIYPGIDEEEPQ